MTLLCKLTYFLLLPLLYAQTDLLPDVSDASTQCDVSSFGAFDGDVHQEIGGHGGGLSVTTLDHMRVYSDVVCSTGRVLLHQRNRLRLAAVVMHRHLDRIRAGSGSAPRLITEVPFLPPNFSQDESDFNQDESDYLAEGSDGQVEHFQAWQPPAPVYAASPPRIPTTTTTTTSTASVARAAATATTTSTASVARAAAAALVPPCVSLAPVAPGASYLCSYCRVLTAPSVANLCIQCRADGLMCSYCHKRGHVAEGCRRLINDRNYLKPPLKRGRPPKRR